MLISKTYDYMCGVVGVWRYGSGPGSVDAQEVATLADSMKRRGPDGAGTWFGDNGKLALAHRRLAIIGLGDQGTQPMELGTGCHGSAGPLVISYNGEIYNYRNLRAALLGQGHRFVGESDTEVLLHLYEEEGIQFVRRLRGMFAFALWDGGARELHLARDPLGIKPLYFADDGTTVRVASQARTLLASPRVSRATDEGALAGFLVLGSVPEPRSAWEAIRAIPAGSTSTLHQGGKRTSEQYFSLPEVLAVSERGENTEGAPGPTEAFAASVLAHLVADVEVGVFLSAGIDSSSILGLASGPDRSLRAVTLGFDEYAGTPRDEVPLARGVAELYGAHHEVGRTTRDQFVSWLPAMLADMDQPTVDGLNTWMVARLTSLCGLKVALSGVGGDEFLGGYASSISVPRLASQLGAIASIPGLGHGARMLADPWVHRRCPKLAGLLEYADSLAHAWLLRRSVFMPWELKRLLGPERATHALAELDIDGVLAAAVAGGPKGAVATVAALDGGLYLRNQLLRDADWAGMAHSLEIRVPLTDIEVLRVVAPWLSKHWKPPHGKRVLAHSPRPALPVEVTDRRKTGFSIPMGHWATNIPSFDGWRRVSSLAHPHCRWVRRWAYVVADSFGML